MFGKMRRFKQQITNEECIEVLKAAPRGILSVLGDDDYPYGMPMNYWFDEENNRIYFHGAKEGHKVDALKKHDKASFCVYDEGFRKEGDWALNIRSVIAFGKVRFVEDPEEKLETVRKIGLRYYPTPESAEEEVRKALNRVQMLALEIEHMTGKLVNES